MYEWSKETMNKIVESNCLNHKDLCCVEIALRMYDIHNKMLNEAIDCGDKEYNFELTHTVVKGYKTNERDNK
jgi:hypothetical protein